MTYKNKKYIALGLVVVFMLLVIFIVVAIRNDKVAHLKDLEDKSGKYGLDGNYKKAIPINIELYEAKTNKFEKAAIANQISQQYFGIQNVVEGNKWAKTAADIYKKLGEENMAQSILDEAKMFERRIKAIKSANPPRQAESGADYAL